MKSTKKENQNRKCEGTDTPRKETIEEMYRKFPMPSPTDDPSRSLRQPSLLKHVKITLGTHTGPLNK